MVQSFVRDGRGPILKAQAGSFASHINGLSQLEVPGTVPWLAVPNAKTFAGRWQLQFVDLDAG